MEMWRQEEAGEEEEEEEEKEEEEVRRQDWAWERSSAGRRWRALF
jgi:hypothetical protein